jgi:hypothetical protein
LLAGEQLLRPVASSKGFFWSGCLWIFRDGKKQVPTRNLVRELEHLICSRQFAARDELIDVLIRGGELEAGLADQGSPAAVVFKNLTDRAAYALIQGREVDKLLSFCAILNQLELPPTLFISPPEGFAYYALPLDFAGSAATLAKPGTSYAVVGIRSIGTTLSAVVTAALKARGAYAERITVRPTGHPYNRVTQLKEEERRWVECHLSLGDKFLIVDEGPGLSGSSFLSLGEVLWQAGVARECVTLLGSREPEVKALRAHDAVSRWSRFAWRRAQGEAFRCMREFLYVGGGIWRAHLLKGQPDWPASWTQMERLKFVSPDRKWFVKFEGLGRFGKKAKEHALCLNQGG